MNDYILRVTAGEGSIRAFFANTPKTAETARSIHNTTPVVSAAFGRMLTAASIMGSMLKGDEIVTLNIKGDGPVKNIVVTADSNARVKGYVFNPNVDIPLKPNGKLDVSGAIGVGSLGIIRDIGLKEPYIGQVPLVSGEIAEDLAHYFAKSEQIPTAVALGTLVDRDYSIKQSGGYIIQLLPGADDLIADMLEQRLADLRPITTLLDEGRTIEEIMDAVLGDFTITTHERIPVKYYCNCSKKRVEKALISVGAKELHDIIEQDGKANLHCHFCGKDYLFSEKDLQDLIKII